MNSRIRTFEDLVVWQKAIAFVKQVYLITAEGDFRRDFGLRVSSVGRRYLFQRTSLKDLSGHLARNIFFFSTLLRDQPVK